MPPLSTPPPVPSSSRGEGQGGGGTVTPAQFVSSAAFDGRLASYDLEASLAHVEMLGRRRILPLPETKRILAALRRLARQVARGGRLQKAEDVHYAIEKSLIRAIGPLGGKMHTARSRNDQTVTALRLYLRDHIDGVRERLRRLALAFAGQAAKNTMHVMPGYTHFQPGQPISVAHHLLAHAWAFTRDRERLADVRRRVNRLPLGAAAMAGTAFPIDRDWVAKRLGFEGVVENAMDAVSDRDFTVEFTAAGALVMAHLSRWAEDLILWSNPALGFVHLTDAFVTGSSIMPQKRNPDMAELLRGKTGRVYGALSALLTIIKGTPLSYNRDFQEDKPPLFDAVDTVEASLDVAIPMTQEMLIDGRKTREACRLGYILATDVADAFAKQGVPFRQAHGIVAKAVAYAASHRQGLEEVPLDFWRQLNPLAGPWIRETLSVHKSVETRRSAGGTAPVECRRQIAALKTRLARP